MPSGACVIRYAGKRGVVFYVKYRDATGRQVKERLGRADEGWTERRAERELGVRLDRVKRERWRKVEPEAFTAFARRFLDEYLPGRNLKRSTLIDYELTVGLDDPDRGRPRRHLAAFFGEKPVAAIEPADVDAYIAEKTREGLSPKTIGNHLTTLSVMFKVARRWRLVDANPVLEVDRPRVEGAEMNVLTEPEIARLLTAYTELELDAGPDELAWWRMARRIVVVALGTALRRGELLALRWRDVALLEGRLTVRESLVRGEFTTPKSRTSRRTIELGPRATAALAEQMAESRYRGDGELVFCHPQIGSPLDASKLSREYLRPALRRAGIDKPFRPWHDLRHTALTHEAAAGNPQVYVQLKAGHSQGSITERYIHAAQVLFPGAAARGEDRMFAGLAPTADDSEPHEAAVLVDEDHSIAETPAVDVATSRYQAAELIRASGLAPVGITVGRPRFRLGYELAGTVRLLAPVGLLKIHDEAEFTHRYVEQLERVGAGRIAARLAELAVAADARGVVLLCFEEPGEFCHRGVFAEWWRAQTGHVVSELA